MNSLQIHNIVEYIKSKDEFPFEVEDVEENLTEILSFFDVFEVFTNEETCLLKEGLSKLALQEEEAEAVRLAFKIGLIQKEDILPTRGEKNEDDE